MNEKLKEPRIILCAAIILMLFLPWVSIDASTSAMGVSASSATSVNGLELLQKAFIGVLVYLIPIFLICAELIPSINISMKLPYLLGSLAGIVFSIIMVLMGKSAGTTSTGGAGISAKTSVSLKIGFWVTIALFVAIIVVTLIKDFALSKEAIQEKGLKNALSEIAGEVSGEVAEKAKNANLGEVGAALSNAAQGVAQKTAAGGGVICPNCGATVKEGKKFCSKCGGKLPEVAGTTKTKKTVKTGPMTVQEYIDSLGDYKCPKCNATVPGSMSFCSQCGEKIVRTAKPEKCEFCGAELIKDKKFCPDCGKEVVEKPLIPKCSFCGATLYFGKKYCVDCGKKVEEN